LWEIETVPQHPFLIKKRVFNQKGDKALKRIMIFLI